MTSCTTMGAKKLNWNSTERQTAFSLGCTKRDSLTGIVIVLLGLTSGDAASSLLQLELTSEDIARSFTLNEGRHARLVNAELKRSRATTCRQWWGSAGAEGTSHWRRVIAMPKPTTVTVNEAGDIHLPARLRRRFPAGSHFNLTSTNGTIVLEPKEPPPTREESMAKFDEGLRILREWAAKNNISGADLKRTQDRLRREDRAQAARRSR